MKAGNVLVGITQLQLMQDVVTHAPGRARRKRRNRTIWEVRPQATQLTVLGTEFVSPLRNAMRLIDGEEGDRHVLQPLDRVSSRQPFRRQVEQAELPGAGLPHHARLLAGVERAVQQRSGNSHLPELHHLVLHQGNQRRDHNRGSVGNDGGQLIAERLAASGRHDHAGVMPVQQAVNNALLHGTEGIVSPVAAQRFQKIDRGGQAMSIPSASSLGFCDR